MALGEPWPLVISIETRPGNKRTSYREDERLSFLKADERLDNPLFLTGIEEDSRCKGDGQLEEVLIFRSGLLLVVEYPRYIEALSDPSQALILLAPLFVSQ